jgi:hypothetical protein
LKDGSKDPDLCQNLLDPEHWMREMLSEPALGQNRRLFVVRWLYRTCGRCLNEPASGTKSVFIMLGICQVVISCMREMFE